MDSELIRALSFFVAGALSHAVLSRFFTQVWFMVFAKDMLHMFLKMLGALSVEIATARVAKYQALEEGEYSEAEINAVKAIDKVVDASWKMALINALVSSFPKRYRHLVTFYDWDGAMKVLQDIYSRESKRYEKK